MKVTVNNKSEKKKILNNQIKHLVLTNRRDRWRKGQIINFLTKGDSNKPTRFHKSTVCSVQKIEIIVTEHQKSNDEYFVIKIDNRILSKNELTDLAIDSGFLDAGDMLKYFLAIQPTGFKGWLIHLTKKKY